MADRSVIVQVGAKVNASGVAELGQDALDAARNLKVAGDAADRLGGDAAKAAQQSGRLGASLDKVSTSSGRAAKSTTQATSALGGYASQGSKLDGFSKRINNNEQSLTRLANASGLLGAGIAVGIGAAVKTYADFDKQMSAVAASAPDAAGQIGKLRAQAIELGADTQYSATEAAKGIENLLKAGVDAQDVLGGGLKGSLNLAAAGELDVGEAAETAATAMTQFKKEGKDVPHIADLLAAGAGKAQGDVHDLGEALNQSGLVASQFGLTIEDTVGTLSAFAGAGLLGSDAGTSLKTMLISLANPAAKTQKLMDGLGISAYDAQGSFVGVTNLAEQLKTKLGPLDEATRNQALAQIFGNDAIRAANVLYEQGGAGIAKRIKDTDDLGYAERQAAARTDNLVGDLERLRGSIDTALIQTGSGANDTLRDLTQGLTGLVNKIGELDPDDLKRGLGIAAVASGALLAFAGISKLVIGAAALKTALVELNVVQGLTGAGAGRLAAGAGIAAGALIAMVAAAKGLDALDDFSVSVDTTSDALLRLSQTSDYAQIDKLFDFKSGSEDIFGQTQSSVDGLVGAFGSLQTKTAGIDQAVDSFFQTTLGDSTKALAQFDALDKSLTGFVAAGKTDEAAQGFATVAKAAHDSGTSYEDLIALFPGYVSGINEQAKALGVSLTAQEKVEAASGKVPASLQRAADASKDTSGAFDDLKSSVQATADSYDTLVKKANAAADSLLKLEGGADAVEAAYDAADQALKDNGRTLDQHTAKGRANRTALRDIVQTSRDLATQRLAEGKSDAIVRAGLDKSAAKYVKTRTAMRGAGVGADEAKKKATELAKTLFALPKNTLIKVHEDGSKVSKDEVDNLNAAIKALPPEKRADVRTEWQNAGYDAARAALNAIDGKTATTYIDTVRRNTVVNTTVNKDGGRSTAGGVVRAYGGKINSGTHTPRADDVMVAASRGEWWIQEPAARLYGDSAMAAINAGRAKIVLGKGSGVEYHALGGKVGGPDAVQAFASGGKVRDVTLNQGLDSVRMLIAALTRPLTDLASATRKFNDAAEASKKAADAVRKPDAALDKANAALASAKKTTKNVDSARQELVAARNAAAPTRTQQRNVNGLQIAYDKANAKAGRIVSKSEQKKLDALQKRLTRAQEIAAPTTSQQNRLDSAQKKYDESKTAREKTIAGAITKKQTAQENYNKAVEAAKAASDRAKDADAARLQVLQQIADQADSTAMAFAGLYQSASTDAADWLDSFKTGAAELTKFNATVEQLRKKGLTESAIQQIIGVAQSSGVGAGQELADSVISSGSSGVANLNKAADALQKIADKLGYTQAVGQGRYAGGGPIGGLGTGTSDSNLIRASRGEFIQPERAVEKYGLPFMQSVQHGTFPRAWAPGFAGGGPIGGGVDARAIQSALAGMSVYVQNPWTGEYLRAQMATTARGVVQHETGKAAVAF